MIFDGLWLKSAYAAVVVGGLGFGEMLHSEHPAPWSYVAGLGGLAWVLVFFVRELRLIDRDRRLYRKKMRELDRRYGGRL